MCALKLSQPSVKVIPQADDMVTTFMITIKVLATFLVYKPVKMAQSGMQLGSGIMNEPCVKWLWIGEQKNLDETNS